MTADARRTPDQERAAHAWKTVEALLKDGKPVAGAKQFGGAARKLPVRIMASGLGQALAFLRAKGKTPLLLQALGGWVLKKPDEAALLDAVIRGTADDLRRLTAETLA